MFSNVEEEKLYSTGNEELDELLERAFCDGYEYAQKEFGRTGKTKEENDKFLKGGNRKKNRKLKKAWEAEQGEGISTQLGGLLGNEIYDADKLAKQEIQLEKIGATNNIFSGRGHGEATKALDRFGVRAKVGAPDPKTISVEEDAINRRKYRNKTKNYERTDTRTLNSSINNRGSYDINSLKKRKYQTPEDFKEMLEDRRKTNREDLMGINKLAAKDEEYINSLKKNKDKKIKEKQATEGFIKKNWDKLGKGGKIAAVAVPTAAAIGTTAIIAKNKKKKNKDKK